MKKYLVAFIAPFLIPDLALAFNKGYEETISGFLMLIFGGPFVLIACIMLIIGMGFKKSIKYVLILISIFFLAEILTLTGVFSAINII